MVDRVNAAKATVERFLERLRVTELSVAFFIFTTFAFNEGATINAASKVLLVSVFAVNLLAGRRIAINPFIVMAAGFLTVSAASLLWTDAPSASSARVLTLAYQFICYFVVTNMITWKRARLELSFSVVIFSALVSGAYVIFIQGATFQDERYVEGVIPSGQLALSCALAIALSIYRFAKTRNAIYLVAIIPLGVFLLLTSSRRGVLIVSLFIFLFIFLSSRGWMKKAVTLVSTAVLLSGLYLLVIHNAFLYAYIGHRLESFVSFVFAGGVGDSSTQGRQRLIDYAFGLFQSSPYLGHGIDTFSTLFSTQPGSWQTSADNNYLQLLADLGVVGFLVYYVPLAVFLFAGLRRISEKSVLARFALSCTVAMCVMDFATVWIFSKVGFLMLVLCYLAVHLERRTFPSLQDPQSELTPTDPRESWWSAKLNGLRSIITKP